ncbi:MAG: ABC-type phosphate/phosphonate transport system substrate-binding protein [Myxococcota bacterium]|jgi:ABC-type phosphate/phosphonate transport system substrate-binding protein
MSTDPLRLLTWMTPSIPRGVFDRIAENLSQALSRPVTVNSSPNRGGPTPGPGNPFSWGTVDIGFMSAPMYRSLQLEAQPTVRLCGAALVFDDPRNQGRPLNWSDIVVRNADPARSLEDLKSRRFGYNDTSSLCGWHAMVEKLRDRPKAAGGPTSPARYFGSLRRTGSHLAAISQLIAGVIDVAALDSNCLLLASRQQGYATSKLRIVESVGPWPVQPIVVRADMPEPTRLAIRDALLAQSDWPDIAISGFAPQTEADLAGAPHHGALVHDSDDADDIDEPGDGASPAGDAAVLPLGQ